MSEYLTEEIVEFLYGHNTSGYSLRQKRKKTMESDYENQLQAVKKISECVKSFEDGCNEEIDTILEKIMDIASAALAKHRRNCERFATWEETLSAFREETGNRKPLELWLKSEIQAFAIWLFAPATEHKGETNGRS